MDDTTAKKTRSFHIKIVTKNKVLGFEVEHRVMPIDTFFPIEIFNYPINGKNKLNN